MRWSVKTTGDMVASEGEAAACVSGFRAIVVPVLSLRPRYRVLIEYQRRSWLHSITATIHREDIVTFYISTELSSSGSVIETSCGNPQRRAGSEPAPDTRRTRGITNSIPPILSTLRARLISSSSRPPSSSLAIASQIAPLKSMKVT